MDKTTIVGFIVAWSLFLLAISMGGSGFGPYFDIPSVLIVIGGTTAVTAGQYEAKDLKRVFPAMKVAFLKTKVEPLEELADKIIYYATEIKKHGAIHVEQRVLEENNPFFREAFAQIVDGTKADVLEPLLDSKLEFIEKRHAIIINLFSNVAGTAGSMGMIGTLVGLIAMLTNLADPSSVGPAMSVALITTLYGSVIGTFFAGIMENKLSQKNASEVSAGELIISGATMISNEESIGNIKMKLKAVLIDAGEE